MVCPGRERSRQILLVLNRPLSPAQVRQRQRQRDLIQPDPVLKELRSVLGSMVWVLWSGFWVPGSYDLGSGSKRLTSVLCPAARPDWEELLMELVEEAELQPWVQCSPAPGTPPPEPSDPPPPPS